MVSDQPTRKVTKELKQAGFTAGRTVGSHTVWEHPSGVSVSIPDGHNRISPGVYRQVLAALKEASK